MKNRMIKIMGIVLTLAILGGLLMAAVPVSAGDLSWTNLDTMPSNTDWQVTDNTTANVYAFAADGKTVFLYNNNPAGLNLFKSVDAGVTWSKTNLGGTLNGNTVTSLVVSPNYATDTTIWAAVGSDIYRSRNAGQTFSNDATYTGTGAILSLSVAPWYISGGNLALLAVSATEIWVYNDNDGWVNFAAGTPATGLDGTAFLGGTFSPNFQSDAQILVVTQNGSATVLNSKVGNANWNNTMKKAVFLTSNSNNIITATKASFAFPSDYNYSTGSLSKVFVGLTGAGATGTYDVFRVGQVMAAGTTGTFNAANLDLSGTDSNANGGIADIAYTGTAAAGTLVASIVGNDDVYNTTNVAATSPTWNSAARNPIGINANLQFVGTTLYAGTEGAFCMSADYNVFQSISLIKANSLSTLSFGSFTIRGDVWFVLLSDSTAPATDWLFKSTDKGASWAAVFVGSNIGGFSTSPAFATDNTVYMYTKGTTPHYVYRSSDGGATWTTLNSTTSDQSIAGFSAIDANSFWMGSNAGGLYKSGSYSKTATLDGTVPSAIIGSPFGLMIKTTTGEIYLSTDNAATFSRLGNAGQFGTASPATTFDVPNKAIYAASTSSAAPSIYKWIVGTSTAWDLVDTVDVGTTPTPYAVKQFSAAGGVVYLTAATSYTGPNPAAGSTQILRTVNLTAPAGKQAFVEMPGTKFDATGFGGYTAQIGLAPLTIVNDKFTGNTVYVPAKITAGTGPNKHSAAIFVYGDILTNAPEISAPTPNAQIPRNFTFTWKPITSPQSLTYGYQVATDAGFNGIAASGTTSATSAYVENLIAGTAYFFRVRVESPLTSPYSATRPFSVQLAGEAAPGIDAEGRLSPVSGATNVPLMPVFTWGAVPGAQSYTLQVADNPFFANPVEKKPLTTTMWVWDTALKPNTTYYWRVQAVAGGNASTWVSQAFTTGSGAAATTGPAGTAPAVTPTVIVPTPVVNVTVPTPTSTAAAPETPVYIWVIIAIGAVLVIAVIVLIARTRRV